MVLHRPIECAVNQALGRTPRRMLSGLSLQQTKSTISLPPRPWEVPMSFRFRVAFIAVLAITSFAWAKDKKKNLLPADLLQAHTVLVIIEPDSGAPLTDPTSNKTALDDVERAIMKWGWLTPVMDTQTADIIITIRKGQRKIVEPTIAGPGVNNRPVVVQSTDKSGRIGAQRGPQPDISPSGPQEGSVHPQIEIGPAEDSFAVYRGKVDQPLERPAVWRYMAKDALRSPSVPAVAEFKKLVDESIKQQQKANP